jgi:hypothetical protein
VRYCKKRFGLCRPSAEQALEVVFAGDGRSRRTSFKSGWRWALASQVQDGLLDALVVFGLLVGKGFHIKLLYNLL